jgi:hypothetical protein
MGYCIAVLVAAINGASRGQNTWTNSVKYMDSAAGVKDVEGGGVSPVAAQITGYAPGQVPMHQYPPPNTPTLQGYPLQAASPGVAYV